MFPASALPVIYYDQFLADLSNFFFKKVYRLQSSVVVSFDTPGFGLEPAVEDAKAVVAPVVVLG